MAFTDKGRFEETMQYIHKYIGSELAVSLNTARDKSRSDGYYGGLISLRGASYRRSGTENQHHAVRALLLCQSVFLKSSWAVGATGGGFDYANDPKKDITRKHYLGKSEEQCKNGLRAYLPVAGAGPEDLARAATEITEPAGGCDFELLTRDLDPFPAMPVCFDALKFWLFKAGFVSIRWLTKTAPPMNAYTVNSILGDGQVVEPRNIDRMPRGYLFNIHRTGAPQVCHWGVTLGNGMAVAANTTSESKGKFVRFARGNKYYGVFDLKDSYEVCRNYYRQVGKEDTAPVTVRQIDPTSVATYF